MPFRNESILHMSKIGSYALYYAVVRIYGHPLYALTFDTLLYSFQKVVSTASADTDSGRLQIVFKLVITTEYHFGLSC